MNILGLNIFHADTSACLVIDGKIVSAVEEERFTRIKHYAGFPINSIKFCLENSKLSIENIDYIAVNFNSKYNFNEKFKFSLFHNPFVILKKFLFSYKKQNIKKIIEKNFSVKFKGKIEYVPHHIAHVSSSYLASGQESSLGLSIDGSGDFSTLEAYTCKKNNLSLLKKINYPHSLGIYYQAFTQFLGFRNYGDEYKMMGLASYGNPIYVDKIKKNIIFFDGTDFKLNLDFFTHHTGEFSYYFENDIPVFENLFSNKINNIFGRPRGRNENIEQFHKDLAASVQDVFENIVISMIKEINKNNEFENFSLSGGCAFNSVLNGKIEKLKMFKNIYISPNVGDAGGSVGAALFTSKKYEKEFLNCKIINSFLGTKYSNNYIEENIIKSTNLKYMKISHQYFNDFDKLIDFSTDLLKEKKVIGWFQDRMEWGPRALGNRSILADPSDSEVRNKINLMVKNREDFRPFAPAILSEYVNEYVESEIESEFMTYVSEAKDKAFTDIPGTVHINKTCRYQTVKETTNKKFYKLIKCFKEKTGIPAVLNTSLNMSEPICENPNQAFELFAKSSMDCIVLQNWVFYK